LATVHHATPESPLTKFVPKITNQALVLHLAGWVDRPRRDVREGMGREESWRGRQAAKCQRRKI
jgi:hypothetical protein